MDLNSAVGKTLLAEGDIARAKPLVGFDHGSDIYHVLLFPEGGGAIGIVREGDNFCARLSLDSLVAFHQQAKATHVQGNG